MVQASSAFTNNLFKRSLYLPHHKLPRVSLDRLQISRGERVDVRLGAANISVTGANMVMIRQQ